MFFRSSGFTQVVIYIALKRLCSHQSKGGSFTQVVIYIALKRCRLRLLRHCRFTQVVIYIALKQEWKKQRTEGVLPRS